jgi:hypothetical protein
MSIINFHCFFRTYLWNLNLVCIKFDTIVEEDALCPSIRKIRDIWMLIRFK